MVNLKHLSVRSFEVIPDNFLENCPFKIESLRWTDGREGSADIILRFLANQTELRRMHVDFHVPDQEYFLPLPACRNLQYIKGEFCAIRALLPRRQVSTLVFQFRKFLGGASMDALERLSKELQQLKVLSILRWPSVGMFNPCLSSISQYLAGLQYLEIHYEEPDLLDLMSQFTSLVGLIFRMLYNNLRSELEEPRASSETGLFFMRCPTLQFIDIPVKVHISRETHEHQRWIPTQSDRRVGMKVPQELFSCSDIEEHMARPH
ncbi:unnamed protein product [Cyclocybe aegerita]|uniref:Uncharacterized protein n=1 Tax=Cyclocybe aegerita TaxID=1973307 RepID=A0A8S0WCE7_CYCAE|nr:unnamed protein product [Cyclocybe aegerita]